MPDFRRGAERQHAARILNEEAVAVFSLFKKMRGHYDGGSRFGETHNSPPEGAACGDVGAGGSFIEKEDGRAVNEGAGERELAFSA